MIVTKITITAYLAEYLFGKFNNGEANAVHFPEDSDVYHVIWQLMMKRPSSTSPVDEGNLPIFLPNRREGKDPRVYNYLSPRSAQIIEKHIRRMFNEELHTQLIDNRERGRLFLDIEVVHQLLCNYGIESVSEDALLKNFYRWRENIRKMRTRRNYKKKLNNVENFSDRKGCFVR